MALKLSSVLFTGSNAIQSINNYSNKTGHKINRPYINNYSNKTGHKINRPYINNYSNKTGHKINRPYINQLPTLF